MATSKDISRGNIAVVFVGFLLIILVVVGFLLWKYRDVPEIAKFLGRSAPVTQNANTSAKLLNETMFACHDSKTVDVSFFVPVESTSSALRTDTTPQPKKSVLVVLSDGRSFTLTQTISGSGVRYANTDETIVFWNKGNTAFIEEGSDHKETYTGCVGASTISGVEGWKLFASTTTGLSVRYPKDYTVNKNYTYDGMGPDTSRIVGVKFTIPATLYQGTNLSGFDTGVSVEQLSSTSTSTCSASSFLAHANAEEKPYTDLGILYSTAFVSNAGAGNFYEERVYAITHSTPCSAVRYFIHATNIGNYTGTVKEFDKAALVAQFDKIRQSLQLGPQ